MFKVGDKVVHYNRHDGFITKGTVTKINNMVHIAFRPSGMIASSYLKNGKFVDEGPVVIFLEATFNSPLMRALNEF